MARVKHQRGELTMKTRTGTGMSRIRLASLALLVGLSLTIAWPLNISAQEEKGFINYKRNQIENNSGNPGANRGTTEIGGNNWGGREWKVKKTNKLYPKYNIGKHEVPTCWVPWDECFTVLVRNANLLLGSGTIQQEAPVKFEPFALKKGELDIGEVQGVKIYTSKDEDHDNVPGSVKSGEQEPVEQPLLYKPVLGSDARATYKGRVVTPGSTTGDLENLPPFSTIHEPGRDDLVNINADISDDVPSGKLPDNFGRADESSSIKYYTSAEVPIREDLQTLGSPDGGVLPLLNRVGTYSHGGAPLLLMKSNRFYATDDIFVVCDADGKKVSATRYNSKTVRKNQKGNSPLWKSIDITGQKLKSTNTDFYGKFTAVPFEPGFGTTIGNSLRRILLSSIEGTAITSTNIEGAVHEFSTIGGEFDPILNPDGPLVSNLNPIEIGILIGQIEVVLQNSNLNEAERKKLEEAKRKLKVKRDKLNGPGGFVQETNGTGLDEFFTGTRILRPDLSSNKPVSVVGNEDINFDSLGSGGTTFIEERGTESLKGSLEYLTDTSWGTHNIPGENGNAPGFVPFSSFTPDSSVKINGATVALDKNDNAVISSKQGIASINSDGSSDVFPRQGGVKHRTNNGDSETSFWFFDPNNIEMVVKDLDGRQDNGRLWIFYGSLTNVSFEMTVTDTQAELVKTYSNSINNFRSVGDTNAY